MQNIRAEVVLGSSDLAGDVAFFQDTLALRMEEIFPADDPAEAVFSGFGARVRLVRGQAPGRLRLRADDPVLLGAARQVSPGGTVVEIAALNPPVETPVPTTEFIVRRLSDDAPWVVGRAGMHYRDLIPGRLGGSIIASHIRIPGGGPVPDMVHYHSVGFQLIFCVRGWVDLVYEDQGPPFRLTPGACVIQPPKIRHRVLHSGDDLEVIEIGVPAEHLTTIDHDLTLPTPNHRPSREWDGQRFVHAVPTGAVWRADRPGIEARDTGIAEGTRGVADVRVLRHCGPSAPFTPTQPIHFTYVLQGDMRLVAQHTRQVSAGDAFVLPAGQVAEYADPSPDLELLQVTLP
ncbi:MAG: cupin domain-containing protein [Pseudomonadota bacterium]